MSFKGLSECRLTERRFLLILISVFRLAASFSFACKAKAGRAGRYADGPAGQVIDYLMESGALPWTPLGLLDLSQPSWTEARL